MSYKVEKEATQNTSLEVTKKSDEANSDGRVNSDDF